MAEPSRNIFRFSLRTLLVLITLVCVYFGWQVRIVQQRKAELQKLRTNYLFEITTAGDDDQTLSASELAHQGIVEAIALGGHVDDVAGLGSQRLDVFERGHEDVDAHDHALPAAEGVVVHRAVAVGGVLANVVEIEFQEAGVAVPLLERQSVRSLLRPARRCGCARLRRRETRKSYRHRCGRSWRSFRSRR